MLGVIQRSLFSHDDERADDEALLALAGIKQVESDSLLTIYISLHVASRFYWTIGDV